MDDVQRRGVEHLRVLLADIERRIENASKEATEVLPPGAVPGFIDTARDWIKAADEVLEATLAADGRRS